MIVRETELPGVWLIDTEVLPLLADL